MTKEERDLQRVLREVEREKEKVLQEERLKQREKEFEKEEEQYTKEKQREYLRASSFTLSLVECMCMCGGACACGVTLSPSVSHVSVTPLFSTRHREAEGGQAGPGPTRVGLRASEERRAGAHPPAPR
jgi:hypothetical protein